jgi:hypothetical protein
VDTRASTDHAAEIYNADGKVLRGIARVLDLSTAGACLESTGEWNVGDELFMRLLLEGRSLLMLPATVVWTRLFTRTQHCGVRFKPLSGETLGKIGAFVESYAARLRGMGPKPFQPDAEDKEAPREF